MRIYLAVTASSGLIFSVCGCVSECALLFLGRAVFQTPQHQKERVLAKLRWTILIPRWMFSGWPAPTRVTLRQQTPRRQKNTLHKILLQKLLQNWNYKINAMVYGCIVIKLPHHVVISISWVKDILRICIVISDLLLFIVLIYISLFYDKSKLNDKLSRQQLSNVFTIFKLQFN